MHAENLRKNLQCLLERVYVMKRTSTVVALVSLIIGIAGGYTFSYEETSGLQSENSTLSIDYANLNSSYNELETNYTLLQSDFSKLTTEFNNLSATSEQLKDDYSMLNESYIELQETYEQANYTRILGVYFSPDGECEAKVIEWMRKANHTLHILIYSFTLDSLSDALVDAQNRGIEVKVVFEKSQISQYSEYWKLRNGGVPVRNDTNSKSMHHKVMIVDDAIVLTGSFNWSQNGQENNNENLVIIDDENVASSYSEEFQNIWDASV